MSNVELTDFEYPSIAKSDYIDDSLDKILARDDASHNGFRRVETFPNVSSEDIGMKVWLVGRGNYQLISVDPNPQWKQLTDDTRDPAYTDWVRDNFQPLSVILSSLARLSGTTRSVPYFNSSTEMQTSALTQFGSDIIGSSNAETVRTLLGLGSIASLNSPMDGSYLKDGTVSKSKLSADTINSFGWTTGDVKLTLKSVADDGWVMMNDGSIGNTASGATTRANADTYNLFMLLWNIPACTLQNSSGETSTKTTAAQDWSANKRLLLPKTMGRALAGAGQGEGLSSRVLGSSVGEESFIESLDNACILKDGTIIQWGSTSSYNELVTFQIPYTSASSYEIADTLLLSSSRYTYGIALSEKTATGFRYAGCTINWIAVGK